MIYIRDWDFVSITNSLVVVFSVQTTVGQSTSGCGESSQSSLMGYYPDSSLQWIQFRYQVRLSLSPFLFSAPKNRVFWRIETHWGLQKYGEFWPIYEFSGLLASFLTYSAADDFCKLPLDWLVLEQTIFYGCVRHFPQETFPMLRKKQGKSLLHKTPNFLCEPKSQDLQVPKTNLESQIWP